MSQKNAIKLKSLYYRNYGKLKFSSIDYKDYLQKLINEIKKLKNEKAFVFIDPYEYKHIKINHIKRLITNTKTEVLLWLPTQFMYRFESNGTPLALKDFLEEIVPIEQWNSSDSVWGFIKPKEKYINSLCDKVFYQNTRMKYLKTGK